MSSWSSLCLSLLFLAALVSPAQAQLTGAAPRLLWEREFSQDGWWWAYQAACLGGDKQIHVLYSASLAPVGGAFPSATNSLGHLRINPDGTAAPATLIATPAPEPALGLTNFVSPAARSVFPINSSNLFAVVEFIWDYPWLVTLGNDGTNLFSRRLSASAKRISVRRARPVSDDTLLVLGHTGFNALVLRTKRDGQILWEQTTDWGRMDFTVDGTVTADKGTVVIGNSGVYDVVGRGPSNFRFLRYDASGKLAVERTLGGRHGAMVAVADRMLAVVYDQSQTLEAHIRLKLVDERTFNDVAEFDVCSGLVSSPFKIKPGRDGSLLVAGSKDKRLFAAKFDLKKGMQWAFLGEHVSRSSDYDLLSDGNGHFYILFSTFAEDPRTKVQRRLKVLKFAEN